MSPQSTRTRLESNLRLGIATAEQTCGSTKWSSLKRAEDAVGSTNICQVSALHLQILNHGENLHRLTWKKPEGTAIAIAWLMRAATRKSERCIFMDSECRATSDVNLVGLEMERTSERT